MNLMSALNNMYLKVEISAKNKLKNMPKVEYGWEHMPYKNL